MVRGDAEDARTREQWARLRGVMVMCLRPNSRNSDVSAVEFFPLYQLVYDLTTEEYAPILYQRIRDLFYAHARRCAKIVASAMPAGFVPFDFGHDDEKEESFRIISALMFLDGAHMTALGRYSALWTAYQVGIKRISAICCAFEKHWVAERRQPLEVIDTSNVTHNTTKNVDPDRVFDKTDLSNLRGPAHAVGVETIPVIPIADLALLAWRDIMLSTVIPQLLEDTQATICNLRETMVVTESKKNVRILNKEREESRKITRYIRVLLESVVAVGDESVLGEKYNNDDDGLASIAIDTTDRRFNESLGVLAARKRVDRKKKLLHMYRTLWERVFLSKAAEFYCREAEHALAAQDANINEYVARVADGGYIDKELEFAKSFCHITTLSTLRQVLERELVSKRKNSLVAEADRLIMNIAATASAEKIDDECNFCLEDGIEEGKKIMDLARLFNTLKCVPDAADIIADGLRWHTTQAGKQAVKQIAGIGIDGTGIKAPREGEPSPAASFARAVWYVYTRMQAVVEHALNSNHACQTALNLACETFVNGTERAPTLLALYMHELLEEDYSIQEEKDLLLLSPGPRCIVEDNNNNIAVLTGPSPWLVRTAELLRFLSDKAEFQRVYEHRLAFRLVFKTSRNTTTTISSTNEEELQAVELLARACGSEHTSRWKRMLGEVETSARLTREYNATLENNNYNSAPPHDFEFNVMALASGIWPIVDNNNMKKKLLGYNATITNNNNSTGSSMADTTTTRTSVAGTAAYQAYLSLPKRIATACEGFARFYAEKQAHTRRQLSWDYGRSRVWLAVRIERTGDATVLVEATIPQAAVLLHLDNNNNNAYITQATLAEALGISLETVDAAVCALEAAGVLTVDYNNNNNNSGGKLVRVAESIRAKKNINKPEAIRAALLVLAPDSEIEAAAAAKKKKEEAEAGAREGDRRSQLAALMVRIMKRERTLAQDTLFQQVRNSNSRCESGTAIIPCEEKELTTTAQYLVDNEYLELNDDGTIYSYLV